ncbi:uncharacterized protein BDZ83DRAFT_277601 [Colletotrichum acutatum]|uniref:Fucose-specific lectin n=1 Tax=Glomerella acutata TaxID=27357 RepID=A0AAD8UL18_GLOAC|nr:uncharacterized protein BDZ83DRAFT_277601 [Colletotrichum acutatum]KAK1725841.1 hypothetical protein BDZ83DRAFT_277601 [Colletotrichum acutatum]
MADAQTYSTLEVDTRQTENGLELHHTESQYLQRTSDFHRKLDNHDHSQANSPQQDEHDSTAKAGRRTTICGLSRRVFIIILVVGLVMLIGAIAGGVAGGLLSRRDNTTKATTRCILSTSRLAAANRTIDENFQKTVFFQDGSGALMARYVLASSTGSTEWTTTNLTSYFKSTVGEIDLPNGAPMVAMSCADWSCGDTSLFYLGTDGIVHDVRDDSGKGGAAWYSDRGGIAKASLRADEGSQLAATLLQRFPTQNDQPVPNGTILVNRLVAYKGQDKSLYVANESVSWAPSELDQIPNLTTNLSLAMITQFGGVILDEISLVAQAVGSNTATTSDFSMVEDRWEGQGWNSQSKNEAILDDILKPQGSSSMATPQFAVTMRNNWLDSIYLALNPDGTIIGRVVGQRNETMDQITLEKSGGEVAKFSAIATTMEGHLYGIVNDTIREYSFDTSDASILHFDGVVYECLTKKIS